MANLTPKQQLLLRNSAANEQSRRIAERLSAGAAPVVTPAETTKRQWELLTQAGRQRKPARKQPIL